MDLGLVLGLASVAYTLVLHHFLAGRQGWLVYLLVYVGALAWTVVIVAAEVAAPLSGGMVTRCWVGLALGAFVVGPVACALWADEASAERDRAATIRNGGERWW